MNLHSSISIPRRLREFLKYSSSFAEKHNKKIEIRPTKYLYFDGGRCAGYCDGNQTVIASKNPRFVKNTSHEIAHLHQAIEKEPLWENCDDSFWTDLSLFRVDIGSWKSVLDTILVERDCEMRSLEFGREFNLFSVKEYAKEANAYLFFYQYVFLKGKWTGTPYSPEILERMPDKIVSIDRLSVIDMKLMEIYDNQ